MPMTQEELQQRLSAAFPNGHITIQDLAGDNDHYAVRVVDTSFQGLNRVAQHRAVMDAVNKDGGDLHALSVKTATPS